MTIEEDIDVIKSHSKISFAVAATQGRTSLTYEEFRFGIDRDRGIDIEDVANRTKYPTGKDLLRSLNFFEFDEHDNLVIPDMCKQKTEVTKYIDANAKEIQAKRERRARYNNPRPPLPRNYVPPARPMPPPPQNHDPVQQAENGAAAQEQFDWNRPRPAEPEEECFQYDGDMKKILPGMTVKFGGSMKRYFPKLPDLPDNCPENHKCLIKAGQKFRKQVRDIDEKHKAYLVRVGLNKPN